MNVPFSSLDFVKFLPFPTFGIPFFSKLHFLSVHRRVALPGLFRCDILASDPLWRPSALYTRALGPETGQSQTRFLGCLVSLLLVGFLRNQPQH